MKLNSISMDYKPLGLSVCLFLGLFIIFMYTPQPIYTSKLTVDKTTLSFTNKQKGSPMKIL